MADYDRDKLTAFSNEGFRVRRVNPDGSYPTVERHLGFTGTRDLSGAGATDVLSYRWDATGPFIDIVSDLSTVGTPPTAATVADVVTALNLVLGFSAVFLASEDVDTGRLMITNAVEVVGKQYLELKGAVAVTLGFGQSGDAGALGTGFVTCFDDTGDIGLPKNLKDSEAIEQETNTGSVRTMMIDAINKGYKPSIALMEELYELRAVIDGGTYDSILRTYTPRTTDTPNAPICALDIFVAKYRDGAVHRGDAYSYKMHIIPRMTGHEADITYAVKSWAQYLYECDALEYIDVDGIKKPAATEKELTIAEALAMGVPA